MFSSRLIEPLKATSGNKKLSKKKRPHSTSTDIPAPPPVQNLGQRPPEHRRQQVSVRTDWTGRHVPWPYRFQNFADSNQNVSSGVLVAKANFCTRKFRVPGTWYSVLALGEGNILRISPHIGEPIAPRQGPRWRQPPSTGGKTSLHRRRFVWFHYSSIITYQACIGPETNAWYT